MMVTEIHWEEVPENGYVIAYFRQGVCFQKMDDEIHVQIENRLSELLELHVFDSEKEYRLVRRQAGGFIEAIVTDQDGEGKIRESKTEKVLVESRFQQVMKHLRVVNYIDYDESGMLSINDYRVAHVEGGE